LTASTKTKKLKTINPGTEEILNEYDIVTREQICTTVKTSRSAFSEWKKDIDMRADLLYDFANEFRKNKENLARIATQEMGKAIKESRSEVEKCAWAIEYFADNGKIFTSDEVVNSDAR